MKHGYRARKTPDRSVVERFYYELRAKTHERIDAFQLNFQGRRELFVSPALWQELKRRYGPNPEMSAGALNGIPVVIDISLPHWKKRPTPRDVKRAAHRIH